MDWVKNIEIKKYIVHFITLIILVLIALYRLYDKPGLWFADEFGYAGTAAYLGGMDWADQIKNIAYYGVGYGLLLAPAYLLCNTSQQVIYYANSFNFIMLIGVFELSVRFLKKLKYDEQSKVIIYLCSLFSTLYINNLVQLQMNWTETLNLFLYWLILNLLINLLQKNRLRTYILLSAFLCFMVIVHMRNIGIVMAACIILLIYLGKTKRVKRSGLILFIIIALLGIILFFYSKELVQDIVWKNSASASVNDIDSSMATVKKAMMINEFPKLIKSILCKLFYAVASTYGLVILGFIHAFKISLEKERNILERLVYFYIVLCFVFQLLIGSVTMINPGRVDCVIYGRYFEHCIGALVGLGIYSLGSESGRNIRKNYLLAIIILLFCALIAHDKIRLFGNTFNVYPCISGVGKYFAKSPNLEEVIIQIVIETILRMSIVLIVYLLISEYKQKRKNIARIILFLPIVIICYSWISDGRTVVDYMLDSEIKRYENINPISNELGKYGYNFRTSEKLYYLVDYEETWNEYLLGLQFTLGKNKLINVPYEEWEVILKNCPKFVIKENTYTNQDIGIMDSFFEEYIPISATNEFVLYKYND